MSGVLKKTVGAALDKVFAGAGGAAGSKAMIQAQEVAEEVFARGKSTEKGEDRLARNREEWSVALPDEPIMSGACCPRSVLFVPCSNAKALRKIGQLRADAFILDLEDSVAPSKKEQARDQLIEMARAGELPKDKPLLVRVNSPRASPQWGFADLEAVGLIADNLFGVALPKTEAGDAEIVEPYLHPDHRLWAFFETPRSILDAPAICAEGRYHAAVMGNNDLAAEMQLPLNVGRPNDYVDADGNAVALPSQGVQRPLLPPRLGLWHSMGAVVLAARAAGIHVIDGVFNDPTDKDGFRHECEEGKRLGFGGKTLIHPSQVPLANTAFSPTEQEMDWALKVRNAIGDAEGGVATVNGKMVEELHARRADSVAAVGRWVEATESALAEQATLDATMERRDTRDDVCTGSLGAAMDMERRVAGGHRDGPRRQNVSRAPKTALCEKWENPKDRLILGRKPGETSSGVEIRDE